MKLIITNAIVVAAATAAVVGVNCCLLYLADTFYKRTARAHFAKRPRLIQMAIVIFRYLLKFFSSFFFCGVASFARLSTLNYLCVELLPFFSIFILVSHKYKYI